MSDNIYIQAIRGDADYIIRKEDPYPWENRNFATFDVLQTPTRVTNDIMSLASEEDKINAYKKWVIGNYTIVNDFQTWDDDPTIQTILLTIDGDNFINEDDGFGPIITADSMRPNTLTEGEIHCRELDKWLSVYKNWTIKVKSM